MRRKQNPESNTMLWILAAGVAAYFAYINNMFSSLGFPYTAATAATTTPVATTTPAAVVATAPVTTPTTVSPVPVHGRWGGGGYSQIEAQLQQLLAAQPSVTPVSATTTTGTSGLFGMGNLFAGR